MPTELVFTTNPSTTTAGTAIDPTTGVQVAVADSYGNVVNSNDSITLSLSTNPGGTTFTPVTATAVNGVASFTGLVIDQSATGYQFTAADLTNPSYISAQSSLFTINPAAAAAITILGGNNQKTAAGTAFTTPLSVQVTDAFGNLIPAAQITFAAPGSGAGLLTPSLVTATNSAGNISYIASADSTVGAYTVTASVLGVATAATFQLSNAAPLSLFAQPVYLKLDSNRQSLDVFTNTNGAGTPSLQIATNLITSVNVNGFGQSAPLTIDFSNGNPLPSIGVNFIGGGSPPTNTLTLIGSTTGDTILFTDMIIHNGNLSQITSQLGQGLISSAATNATTLAIELNNDGNGNPLMTTFDNQPVTNTDVLIKFTYFGDTNLDGSVTAADYLAIDNAFSFNATNPATPLTGWNNGDFNYDGVINGDDYTLIDNAFNSQNTVPLVSQAISFPSPTIPQTIAPKTVTFPPAIAQADSSAPIWPFDFNPLNKRKPSLANGNNILDKSIPLR
jgi:hypothetical protein